MSTRWTWALFSATSRAPVRRGGGGVDEEGKGDVEAVAEHEGDLHPLLEGEVRHPLQGLGRHRWNEAADGRRG